MMVLVSYDVSTQDSGAARRLRQLARKCQDYGQRVQYSVFEIELTPVLWVRLKADLCAIADPEVDSLRFYYMGRHWQSRVEHVGAKPAVDLNGPLVL